MYAYHISPNDFGSDKLKTVEETAAEVGTLTAPFALYGRPTGAPIELSVGDISALWKTVTNVAPSDGSKAECRQGPVVFSVPHEGGVKYGFAFKKDSDGSTCVVSPIRMPWLEQ